MRFVEADFTRDPVADRLRAAGLDPDTPSLFLLEGVAVYLEPAVLEDVLGQFRQVAAPGSSLAISVSLSRPRGDSARARFQATVAALGEPARSTFEAAEAEALLARTGWQLAAATGDDRQAAVGRDRLRTAGLLLASAGPAVPAGPQPRPRQTRAARHRAAPAQPRHPHPVASHPKGTTVPCPCRPCCPRRWSRSRSSSTTRPNTASRTAPPATGRPAPDDGAPKPWLVSLAMWENCMRYVTGEPITVGDLEVRARTGTNLDGMRRWGYLTIDGTARKVHNGRPSPGAVLRATAAGQQAREIWRPLPGLIEQRWHERFGAERLGRLRGPLTGMVGLLDPGLPDCLPILGAALLSAGPDPRLPPRPDGIAPEAMPLSALLSRVLLSFAVEYEREAGLSLAVAANVLRVLGTGATRLRDLPALTGTSRESVRWALGILTRGDLAAEEPDPAASRGKVARLTPRGLDAQRLYHELTGEIERRWHDRFTLAVTAALRDSLEPLAAGQPPALFGGLEPYPDNWRALVRRPDVLPHFPMVLHRGGYPDGS